MSSLFFGRFLHKKEYENGFIGVIIIYPMISPFGGWYIKVSMILGKKGDGITAYEDKNIIDEIFLNNAETMLDEFVEKMKKGCQFPC